jgi:hypothetical protein
VGLCRADKTGPHKWVWLFMRDIGPADIKHRKRGGRRSRAKTTPGDYTPPQGLPIHSTSRCKHCGRPSPLAFYCSSTCREAHYASNRPGDH